MKCAWLKGDERHYVFQGTLDLAQRHRLCVGLIGRLGKSSGNDHSAADKDAADGRIWQARRQRQLPLRDGLAHESFEGLTVLAHSLIALLYVVSPP
jgi:hypothetical protein